MGFFLFWIIFLTQSLMSHLHLQHFRCFLPSQKFISIPTAGGILKLSLNELPGTAVLGACWWLQFLILMKLRPDTHLQCSARGRGGGVHVWQPTVERAADGPMFYPRSLILSTCTSAESHMHASAVEPCVVMRAHPEQHLNLLYILDYRLPRFKLLSYHVDETSWDASHATSLWGWRECRGLQGGRPKIKFIVFVIMVRTLSLAGNHTVNIMWDSVLLLFLIIHQPYKKLNIYKFSVL